MKKVLQRAETFVVGLWKREPVRVATTAAAAVVFIAAKAGLVVPEADVLQALVVILPILFSGEVARANVTPSK